MDAMRIYLLLMACEVVFLTFGTETVQADTVLDQSFLSSSTIQDGGIGSGHYGAPIAIQTFTVGRSGTLSTVEIPLTSLNLPSVLTAAIYTISAGIPTSTRLGSASVDGAILPTHGLYPFHEAELTKFDYGAQKIAVTAGDQLAIVLTATEPFPGASGAYYYYGSGYTGGSFALDIGTGPMSFFPYSIFFQTFVETTIVPEPTSVALLSVSLVGLLVYIRLRHARRRALVQTRTELS